MALYDSTGKLVLPTLGNIARTPGAAYQVSALGNILPELAPGTLPHQAIAPRNAGDMQRYREMTGCRVKILGMRPDLLLLGICG